MIQEGAACELSASRLKAENIGGPREGTMQGPDINPSESEENPPNSEGKNTEVTASSEKDTTIRIQNSEVSPIQKKETENSNFVNQLKTEKKQAESRLAAEKQTREKLEKERKVIEADLNKQKETNNTYRESLTKMESEVAKLQNQVTSKSKDNESLQQKIDALIKEKSEAKIPVSKIENNRSASTDQNVDVERLREQLSSISKERDDLTRKLESLKKEKDAIISKERDKQLTLEKNITDLKNKAALTSASPSAEVEKLKEDIENLRNRLSQVSGSQLLHNNPNIADLSDSNRATKLAERYTELYDNEWTDAFEEEIESGNKTERNAIDHLYDTLKGAYDYCKTEFAEYADGAKGSLVYFKGKEGKFDELPILVDKQIKDTLKSFAPALTDKIKESYMSKKSAADRPKKNTYIRKCIELCWLMSIQDPPVVFATKTPTEFNLDLYKAYTKSGKQVDYVVMPPLHLHEGGALLAKGTAQGKL